MSEALDRGRQDRRRAVRRRRQSSARVGPLGHPRLDARHDGHRAQSRPQRSDRRGARAPLGRPADLPTTPIAASSRCMPTWCSASTTSCSRRSSRTTKISRASNSTLSSAPRIGWRSSSRYKALVESELGEPFPQDLHVQLWGAIAAVFGSWQNARAIAYRRLHDIPDDWGTAVTIQAMVFGNRGDQSATGVVFTRNPSTGAKELYGEFLVNAQGEDVVSGLRTPQPLTEAARKASTGDRRPSLEALDARRVRRAEARLRQARSAFPRHPGHRVHRARKASCSCCRPARASAHAGRAQDRRRHGRAEGLISREEAVAGIDAGPARPAACIRRSIPTPTRPCIAKGLPASPGAASGELVFDADEAVHLKAQGHTVILARVETSPEDVQGMHAAAGILTTRGGMTSHAAVVARGMGRPCVVGASAVQIDLERETLHGRRRASAQGRHRHHRRLDRADHQGPRADARAESLGGLHHADAAGPTTSAACGCAPMPTRRPTPARRAPSAPRASGSAAPSICSSRRAASSPCAR